jgi:glucose/arabinose dehydrogenase
MSTLILCAGMLPVITAGLPVDQLELPTGFEIELYAQVDNARQLAPGDKGTVFAGSRNAGKVHALVDSDGDHKADKTYLVANDLNMPSGIAFRDGDLYVAAVNRVLRYDAVGSRLSDPSEPVVITSSLPDDVHHG